MEMKRLKKTIMYDHDMSTYDLDGDEFEVGVKRLRKEKRLATKRLKQLGATDDILIRFVLDNEYWYGDSEMKFELKCTGTRFETDLEMHARNKKNAKAAETRALKKLKEEEKERRLLATLKQKYES